MAMEYEERRGRGGKEWHTFEVVSALGVPLVRLSEEREVVVVVVRGQGWFCGSKGMVGIYSPSDGSVDMFARCVALGLGGLDHGGRIVLYCS